jgi:hypothetical protein
MLKESGTSTSIEYLHLRFLFSGSEPVKNDPQAKPVSRGGILDRSAHQRVCTISVKCVRQNIQMEGEREDLE